MGAADIDLSWAVGWEGGRRNARFRTMSRKWSCFNGIEKVWRGGEDSLEGVISPVQRCPRNGEEHVHSLYREDEWGKSYTEYGSQGPPEYRNTR